MFGPLNPNEAARLVQLPNINRARGSRLYTLDGARWLDCWVDGGRALMGHRPKGVSIRLKNEIDRGLYAPYPSLWEGRLVKALMSLFPGYTSVRIYRNIDRALAALNMKAPPVDPLDRPAGEGASVLWGRPLLPEHPVAEYLFPILPIPGLTDIQPVMIKTANSGLLPSDQVSSVLLAALTRSCASISYRNTPIPDEFADIWERRGPYMMFRGGEEEYNNIFDSLFARKVLVAPSVMRPSVFPAEISAGEISVLSGRSFA